MQDMRDQLHIQRAALTTSALDMRTQTEENQSSLYSVARLVWCSLPQQSLVPSQQLPLQLSCTNPRPCTRGRHLGAPRAEQH